MPLKQNSKEPVAGKNNKPLSQGGKKLLFAPQALWPWLWNATACRCFSSGRLLPGMAPIVPGIHCLLQTRVAQIARYLCGEAAGCID